MCAQPAPPDRPDILPDNTGVISDPAPPPRRRGPQTSITPLQWVGLTVLIVLFLNQSGFIHLSGEGVGFGTIGNQLPRWVALILAITVHEFSHGLVATLFGDSVPRRAGRLTLNPLKHLDPLGTLMILIGPIGWGRPMPINPAGMRNPNLGWALSSAAGPTSNVLFAAATLAVYRLLAPSLDPVILPYFKALFLLNIALAVFNLVPLPPLDGFGFVFGLSPKPLKMLLAPLWRYGPMLLLAVLLLPLLLPGFPPILSDVIGLGEELLVILLHGQVLLGA